MKRALWALSCLALGGCPAPGTTPKGKPAPVDADTNSGPEAQRSGARPLPAGRAQTDAVSWPKLMRTKWKTVDLGALGRDNILDCQVAIDRADVDLDLDIFNAIGTQIGFSPGPTPAKSKRLAVSISEPGTYFVRVRAARPQDESDFSLRCDWDPNAPRGKPKIDLPDLGTGEEPDLAPVAVLPPGELPPDAGVEGRVVGAYREGEFLMLQMNKGSAAGVRVGMKGKLLEGKAGRKVLEGGDFEVLRVVGPAQCIARVRLPAVGANLRAVFLTK
jgi:hypothetical protein